uniref:Uncharacterized protein n=1 Tax=Chromera velia CCMP2878 TaxID=1169474 RepID=A0A0G4H3V2_9ALVE|eukprot:Cvel_24591.t1-p1 / transcript=Cvel_24591.t1 / gene=Cvel_24591 / organism=Chromera_velia_CCMP2878 / gene_product=hypothetical protein / transcript_product=hypothetical protein / location=Cvel_scaffold2678:1279-1617(-) / protein_length=113 / sequence_SO=supercontig / SO=protein_coding / is_pseudo=false
MHTLRFGSREDLWLRGSQRGVSSFLNEVAEIMKDEVAETGSVPEVDVWEAVRKPEAQCKGTDKFLPANLRKFESFVQKKKEKPGESSPVNGKSSGVSVEELRERCGWKAPTLI